MSPGARAGIGPVLHRQIRSEELHYRCLAKPRSNLRWGLSASTIAKPRSRLRFHFQPKDPTVAAALPSRSFGYVPRPSEDFRGSRVFQTGWLSLPHRKWFQNLFFFPGVTPSIRRANPRSQCVEAAPLGRVAQGSKGQLIHQLRFSLWISVENFCPPCCRCEATRLAHRILRSCGISGPVSPADAVEAH